MEVVRRGTKSGHSYELLAYDQGPGDAAQGVQSGRDLAGFNLGQHAPADACLLRDLGNGELVALAQFTHRAAQRLGEQWRDDGAGFGLVWNLL